MKLKKFGKKLIATLLSAAMVFTMGTTAAFAEDTVPDVVWNTTVNTKDQGITPDYSTEITINVSELPTDVATTATYAEYITIDKSTQTGIDDIYSIKLTGCKNTTIDSVTGTVSFYDGIKIGRKELDIELTKNNGVWYYDIPETLVDPRVNTLNIKMTHTCDYDTNNDGEDDVTTTSAPTCTDVGAGTKTCQYCGHTETVTISALGHDYKDQPYISDGESGHHKECSRCDATTSIAPHNYTDDFDTTCNTCDYVRTVNPPAHEHIWTEAYNKDDNYHWHTCSADGCTLTDKSQMNGYGSHVYDNDSDPTCNTCGYVRTVTPPAHEHI